MLGGILGLYFGGKLAGSIWDNAVKGFALLFCIVTVPVLAPIVIPIAVIVLKKQRFVPYKQNEDGSFTVWAKDVFSGMPLKRTCQQAELFMIPKSAGFSRKEMKQMFPLSVESGEFLKLKKK